MARLSHRLTVERFGRTMQLYAPMYLTNVCSNICTYCGFSAQNRIPRKALDDAEIAADAGVLEGHGFEHVLLVTGESSRYGTAYLRNALRLLRPRFSSLSMEVQPLGESDYAELAADGLNAVLVYQETYDPTVYPRHHLKGPKSDMRFRLETPDRIGRAGVKKIGLGALYGLSRLAGRVVVRRVAPALPRAPLLALALQPVFPRLRPHEGQDIALTPFRERDLIQAALRIPPPEPRGRAVAVDPRKRRISQPGVPAGLHDDERGLPDKSRRLLERPGLARAVRDRRQPESGGDRRLPARGQDTSRCGRTGTRPMTGRAGTSAA